MVNKLKKLLSIAGLEQFNKYYGIYKGFVGSNEDPENIGRLQVQVPQVYGKDKTFKYWALPKGIYSGNGIGSFFIPNQGDPIWVEFENGDTRFPVWSYGWWAKDYTPDGATPKVKVIVTTTGQRIELDDDKEEIRVKDSNSNELHLNAKGISLVIGGTNTKINLGTLDGAAEAAALGDTLKGKLEEVLDLVDSTLGEIFNLTTLVSGTAGSTSPISKGTITTVRAQVALLKPQLTNILSKKVTLD